jgi:flagellar FliL protein
MAEKKEAAENGEGADAPKPKGKKKLILIVVGVLVLVAGAGVPMMLMGGKEEKTELENAEPEEEIQDLKIADLGTFIVNLSESAAFLKVAIKIEYDAALAAKLSSAEGGRGGGGGHGGGGSGGGAAADPTGLPPILKSREPAIRDAIIRVLSSRKSEDVLSVEGKDKLKEDLIEAVNDASGTEPVVTNIYFSDFIVQ